MNLFKILDIFALNVNNYTVHFFLSMQYIFHNTSLWFTDLCIYMNLKCSSFLVLTTITKVCRNKIKLIFLGLGKLGSASIENSVELLLFISFKSICR